MVKHNDWRTWDIPKELFYENGRSCILKKNQNQTVFISKIKSNAEKSACVLKKLVVN